MCRGRIGVNTNKVLKVCNILSVLHKKVHFLCSTDVLLHKKGFSFFNEAVERWRNLLIGLSNFFLKLLIRLSKFGRIEYAFGNKLPLWLFGFLY